MKQLKIAPLTDEKIAQAFPLAQLLIPGLTHERWLELARSHTPRDETQDRGFLMVETEQNLILGMVQYSIDHMFEHGRTLMVQNLIALHLLDRLRRDVAKLLVDAVEDVARVQACTAIRTQMTNVDFLKRHLWILDVLTTNGHEPKDVTLVKTLREEAEGSDDSKA